MLLYLLVKTEESQNERVAFKDNRLFIGGEDSIKYSYNNRHIAIDPILASTNFLKALERIPVLLNTSQIIGRWRKIFQFSKN